MSNTAIRAASAGWSSNNDDLNSATQVLALSVSDTGIGISQDKQQIVFEAFQQVFSDTRAQKGAAVALDPKTGGVLALLSLPSFDSDAFSAGIGTKEWNALSQNPLQDDTRQLEPSFGFNQTKP